MEEIKTIRQKRKRFSIVRSVYELGEVMPDLPEDEVYKLISDGHFSSISFIKYVADRTKIHALYASSFRIGRKELQMIDALHKQGKIGHCVFAIGALMARDKASKKYHYYDNFKDVCEANGWEYATVNNHSKLILLDTDCGQYILETSGNLNENPKIEQFSFEKDPVLFEFYKGAFERWVGDG